MGRLRLFVGLLVVLLIGGPAWAWNLNGHMVVAALVYRELKATKPSALLKIHAILKAHPHYEEFLSSERPPTVSEAQWAFLRASYWPDWVRSGPPSRTQYNVPARHYINRAFVWPGEESFVNQAAANDVPPENVLAGLTNVTKTLEEGTESPEKLAIALCWFLHLGGDVHQPLHCQSSYGKAYPKGDQGGNLFNVTSNGKVMKLHAYWDDLLVPEFQINYASVDALVNELQHNPQLQRSELQALIANDQFIDWVDQSSALAREVAYKNGILEGINLAAHNHDPQPPPVPPLPAGYAEAARELAKRRAALAGYRMSDRLAKIYGN